MFKRASKDLAKLKIALTGPSGSGKTFSALRLARGIGGKTAVIDTENNSASLYADKFGDWFYDIAPISPPYTAQKYFGAIEFAIKEKYDILILDSITHLWAGEGGLLQQKEALDSRGGNSYTNWGKITNIHEKFKSLLLHSPLHLIATMRSKQEYIMEANEKGKMAPKKVGLAPIQRDGMEYEFTTVFDIGMDHQFMASKDRTGLFDGVVDVLSERTGQALREWTAGSTTEEVKQELVEQAEQPKEEKKTVMNHATGETIVITGDPDGVGNGGSSGPEPEKPKGDVIARLRDQHVTNPPPKNETPQSPGQGDDPFSPGDYVVNFGTKYKDRRLNEIPLNELKSYMNFCKSSPESKRGNRVNEFLEYADQYLVELQAKADGKTEEIANADEIPF